MHPVECEAVLSSTWRTLPHQPRRDRGEADPVLVLTSLAVLVLIIAGTTFGIIQAQRWGTTHSFDSQEQSTEDSARLAWMADVGTATKVVPAAKAGTTAKTSVRFDNTRRESSWPAGAQCRASTWWLERTTMDPNSPNALDPTTGKPVPAVAVHRSVAYYSQTQADGSCVTTGKPTAVAESTPIKNAKPGAEFTYVNGHLRDLRYPSVAGASAGIEACTGIDKGAAAALTACTGGSAPTVPQRTQWEWADPTPVQVLLEMTTEQSGVGAGYGTQIGTREVAGRRELVGDPNSPVVDTLVNPPAPAKPVAAPEVTPNRVTDAPNDATADFVTAKRTDTRDLNGFEYQCRETLDGANTRDLGPFEMATTNPAAAQTIPDTRPGRAYQCRQRGWVTAVQPVTEGPTTIQPGERFAAGVSPWSDYSALKTRRPQSTAVNSATVANNVFSYAWEAREGATRYELRYQVNAGEWSEVLNLPPSQLSWSSARYPFDTRVRIQVRPVNDGGAPAWATSGWVNLTFEAPSVGMDAGAVGRASYGSWWGHVSDFNAALGHKYEIQFRQANSASWSTVEQTESSFVVNDVVAGRTASVRVRAKGVNAGNSDWSNVAAATRPVAPPAAPGVNMGTTTGAVTTSANAVWCEPGTTAQYAVWGSTVGWRGWGASQSASFSAAEGTVISVAWKARCVPGEGNVGGESPETGGSARVPYTRPGSVKAYNSGSGFVGTNVTFSWTASGAGYFRVYNSALSTLRYSGSGSAVSVARESGATTARVFAFRSVAHYNAGVAEGDWSKYAMSATTSAATTINPYPSAWGDRAGCPTLERYITPGSASSFQVRRASETTCELRWRVTEAGSRPDLPAGTVLAIGRLTLNTGATKFTQISGDESFPMAPLFG